jgi:dihydrolipoamide dehydrogenase
MADTSVREVQLAVLGGGPGGYAAAFHAADLGLEVAVISEEEKLGGVCLHRGCIPSKALLHAAKLITESQDSKEWGIEFEDPKINLDALRGWKDGIVDRLTSGVNQLAKARKVDIIVARGSFLDSNTIHLESVPGSPDDLPRKVKFQHAILATGSFPAIPKVFQVEDKRIWDSTSALALESIPEKLLVIGGGYIGLEMGTVYAALGSKITVIELLDGILPGVDRDLVRPLQKRLEGMFDAIHLETKVTGLEPKDEGIVVRVEGKDIPGKMTFDSVLVSVGRVPNSENLGLSNTRVKVTDRGFVKVNQKQQTDDPSIYAIGDVVGGAMLAHKASREGKVAAEAIAGGVAEFDNVAIPAVVFTDPEVAYTGLTETQAKEQGIKVQTARFPWTASGRALTLGRTDGVTKMIFDPETERLLGVGITGPGAGELIAEATLAVEMAAVARDVADTIHTHPTLSETVMESAEMFLGHATHVFRPKRK